MIKKRFFYTFYLLILLPLALPLTAYSHNNTGSGSITYTGNIKTQNGPIKGKLAHNVKEFLGIPYAAPPTGSLRWKPPQAHSSWSQVKKVTSYGGRCAQPKSGPFARQTSNENCLYLNIFEPKHIAKNKELPVMVWIPGGGLATGEGSDYNGRWLAQKGHVIVVTINYRLNVFGFLALPGLDHKGKPFANYGLMDQQYALKWVQKNIADFNGDPNNVTIFGQSAGGLSVLANLISPTSKGLFNKAIIESGSYTHWSTPISQTVAEQRGDIFAKATGCKRATPSKTVACLRSLTSRQIQSRAYNIDSNNIFALPHIIRDGTVIKHTLGYALKHGDFHHVPVMIGTTRNEMTTFVGAKIHKTGKTYTKKGYQKYIEKTYGTEAWKILQTYPASKYQTPENALASIETDSVFACSSIKDADTLSQYTPTYVYEFNDQKAPSYLRKTAIQYGAYHTSELQYLFPKFHGQQGPKHSLSQKQHKLSDTMIDYWTNFARSGNPNATDVPHWPRFENAKYQSLNTPNVQTLKKPNFIKEHHCGLWK